MTHWQLLTRPSYLFPDQTRLRHVAMEAFDAFVPKRADGKNLDDITDRMNPKKRSKLADMLMMKSIFELRNMVAMDAMGSPINNSYLNGFDGPLFGLADALGIQKESLNGLVQVMKDAVSKEINEFRSQQEGYPRFGTNWQHSQGSQYR